MGIDRTNDTFKVVCLNPMGVKLFDLTGDRNSVTPRDVIPALANYGDLPRAVGGLRDLLPGRVGWRPRPAHRDEPGEDGYCPALFMSQ